MPMRWKIHHDKKLVHIVAEGPIVLKEMEEHFDAIVVANAMPYAKLFDARTAIPSYDEHDLLMMGARLSIYTATLDSGPLAMVADGTPLELAFRRFINVSPSKRPAALFKSEAEARAWLGVQGFPT